MTHAFANERRLILLLCVLGAIHTFIFSAAFPFFNNVDEHSHFDLVTKYVGWHFPAGMQPVTSVSTNYFVLYDSPEFISPAGPKAPKPSWTRSTDEIARVPDPQSAWWPDRNYESSQPPLYYLLAGAWWDVGKACGQHGGHLLYWLRFLNVGFMAALVWVGYRAAAMIFPANAFLQIGVPAWLAFFPQPAFYCVQNDMLSPLCFGALLILLVKFWRAKIPSPGLAAATGLLLGATFLVKLTNLPELAVAALVLLAKIAQLARGGKFRESIRTVLLLALCGGLPMIAWMAWCRHSFGDCLGTEEKIAYLGWTHKPFAQWWHHPIFTFNGAWTFLSLLLATFWQGEFWWHGESLGLPATNAFYTVTSLVFVGLAVRAQFSKRLAALPAQRQALWLCFWSCVAAVVFLGFNSIIYDFHDCIYPSRALPYFWGGRLMLGALIPFLMLYLCGIDYLLQGVRQRWVRPAILIGMILFMCISEIVTDWTVFSSQFNWFHM